MERKTVTKPALRNLNDSCEGGFILFSFDEDGIPKMDSNFGSNAEAMALQLYVQNWCKAVEAASIEQMAQSIIDYPPEEEGGEEI